MSDFDLRTHIRDPQTKRVTSVNHYRKHIVKEGTFYERPVNSGHLWYGDNTPAGQLVLDAKGNKEFQRGVEHVPWKAPLSKDAKVLKALHDQQNVIQELENKVALMELAAIKAEKDAVVVSAPIVASAEPAVVIQEKEPKQDPAKKDYY